MTRDKVAGAWLWVEALAQLLKRYAWQTLVFILSVSGVVFWLLVTYKYGRPR